jgi:hypothetical protein
MVLMAEKGNIEEKLLAFKNTLVLEKRKTEHPYPVEIRILLSKFSTLYSVHCLNYSCLESRCYEYDSYII